MKKCFFASPIGEDGSEIRRRSDNVKKYFLDPICEKYGFKVTRIDQELLIGTILDKITDHLDRDELVIADITGNNANVFLEIGYRMAVKKPIILIAHNREHPYPFDISGYNILSYGMNVDEADVFKTKLDRMINSLKDHDPEKSTYENIRTGLGSDCAYVFDAIMSEYKKRRNNGKDFSHAAYFGRGTEEVMSFVTKYTFDDLDQIIRALAEKGYLRIQTADLRVMTIEIPRDIIL